MRPDSSPHEPPHSSDAAAWLLLLFLFAANIALQLRSPLPIEPAGFRNLVLACCALGGAAFYYGRVRAMPNFAAMCLGLMQVLLFSALGAMLSYLLAREGGALWDERFTVLDRALGFNWLAVVRLVDSQPWIAVPLHWAYGSLIPQIIVLVLALGFTLRLVELRSVLLAAMVSGTATILLSPLFPAVSNFVHLGLDPAAFAHVQPWAGYTHLRDVEALRSGAMVAMDLPRMQGIITFPSYHAGLATVTLYGFWISRIGWLRWSGGGIALLTIVATPIDGGHYLVDVIAGVAIGAASVVAARRLVFWEGPLLPFRASPFRRSRAASAR